MDRREITSFEDLNRCFDEFHRFQGWVYRGQANSAWSLIPKLARSPVLQASLTEALLAKLEEAGHSDASEKSDSLQLVDDNTLYRQLIEAVSIRQRELLQLTLEIMHLFEQKSLATWMRLSRPFLRILPRYDWEWLAIGQHYGLSTRFLDWTANPLTATFFAVSTLSDKPDGPASIYGLRCPHLLDETQPIDEFKGAAIYSPPHLIDRVVRQHAYFSVSEVPFKDMRTSIVDGVSLVEFVIPAKIRETLLRKIIAFGVDQSTLFPDLGGVAMHIDWFMNNSVLLARGESGFHQKLAQLGEDLRSVMAKEEEAKAKLKSIKGEIA